MKSTAKIVEEILDVLTHYTLIHDDPKSARPSWRIMRKY